MIADLHFIRPWWLLALLPLVALLPLWLKQLRQPQQLTTLVAPHLLAALGSSNEQKSNRAIWLASLCWLIASVAAAGPSWLKVDSPTVSLDRGRVILIDASLATRANDVRPDRFEQLRFKAHDLLNTINEGYTGLVAYAGDAFVVAPLTNDPQNILHMLPALSPEIMPEPGSNPLLGFQQAHQLLSQAGYTQADIFWLTGSIERDQMEDVLRYFRQQGQNYRVSIIATGTSEGAPVRTQRGELLRDRQGRLVIPKLYPEYLERISQTTQGSYFLASADDTDIQALAALPPQSADYITQANQAGYDSWLDFGPYLALLLLPLLLLLAYSLGNSASSLSVLFLAPITMLLVSGGMYPAPAMAQEHTTERIHQKTFQNNEQRSLNLYQQQQFSSAAQLSNNPMLKGMAYYRQGNFDLAAEQFGQLNTPEAHYNRGNSLAKNGQLESAISAYSSALEQRPNWPEAEQNLRLAEQLLNQQQEQQDQNNQSGQEPSAGEQEPSAQEQEPSAGEQEPSAQEQEPSAQEQEPSAQEQEPSAQEQEPSAQEQEPSAGEQEPSTQEQEPSTQEQEPSAQEQEPSSGEQEPSADPENVLPAAWDNLSDEEQEELTRLLRQLNDDPADLLRTRLLREAERRRMRRFN
ncbi:MAG TPA: VWA domain-containing protein [Aliidiomarina sp.]|nr:VWA domain-containing protein [Aliidiomarina sp.]